MPAIWSRGLVVVGVLLLGLAAAPLFGVSNYVEHVIIIACIWAIVAASWDLSLGYGGIFNFAHIAFFGLGVYVYAVGAKVLGLPSLAALPLAGLMAALIAAVITLPVLRLKGIYIILATFAFSQLILQLILSQNQVTGGAQGMVLLPTLSFNGLRLSSYGKVGFYYLAIALLLAATAALRAIALSDFGRSIVALKENEDYAVARGVSIGRQRLIVLMASAAPTGIAGAFYAAYLRVASPEVFGFDTLSIVLIILLLGGTSSVTGPVIAAFLVTGSTEAMSDLGPARFMIIAVVIVIILRFYPGGLDALIERLWPPKLIRGS
ncbi:MAG: branched-chain amino acid ABC transporter permease [Roseiarcus sp.]